VGAVGVEDIRRVAKRLSADPALLFSVVGRPTGLAPNGG